VNLEKETGQTRDGYG